MKNNNCFLIKQFGNNNAKVQFRKEPSNLYNVRSYKFSDLVNSKTVLVHPSAGGCCPVHEQDQAGHPCQAAAQASNVQVF